MKYIVFEGADGTGKTTLATEFQAQNKYWRTHEPLGQGEICSNLRKYCLDKKYNEEINPIAREYLMAANRAISTKWIKDFLSKSNDKIISDRSFISGMVYAKVASGISFDKWWKLFASAIQIFPELIIYVTTDKQNINIVEGDIYDIEKEEFHKQIKETFIEALEFVKDKIGINYIIFKNDFSLSPEENAKNLKDQYLYDNYDLKIIKSNKHCHLVNNSRNRISYERFKKITNHLKEYCSWDISFDIYPNQPIYLYYESSDVLFKAIKLYDKTLNIIIKEI